MCQCWDEQGKCEAGIECGICSCRLCGRRRWMLVLLTHWQCNVCAPPPPTDHSPHTGRPGASQTTHWVWDNQFSFYHYRQYYHVTKTLPTPEGVTQHCVNFLSRCLPSVPHYVHSAPCSRLIISRSQTLAQWRRALRSSETRTESDTAKWGASKPDIMRRMQT